VADRLIAQEDFSAGIFRGRVAPKNAVYDAVNSLVGDERELYRRGGSTYLTTSDHGDTLLGVWTGYLAAGHRTLAWGSSTLRVVDAAGTGWVTPHITSGTPEGPTVRPVTLGGYVLIRGAGNWLYAGSRKTAGYSTGTVAISGSTVTGTGTAWLANVDAGMILTVGGTSFGIVASVDSDTSIALEDPWPSTVGAGAAYTLSAITAPPSASPPTGTLRAYGVAGSRLLVGADNRVYFTEPVSTSSMVSPFALSTTRYHQLPDNAMVLGIEGLGDTALVFTTAGVFTIENLYLDPLDDAGNQQHTVRHVNRDLILWGERGLAGWGGGAICPGLDDVYLVGADGYAEPIGEGIRPLYRAYVEAGQMPGYAAVHRRHYFLPVVGGLVGVGVLVDTGALVCRLDRGAAWTRWDDHAAGAAYTVKVGADTREPKLYGIAGQRVTDLTGCFDPDAARDDDADGTDHQMTVETRDYDLAGDSRLPGTAERAEAFYELDGTGCTVALSWAAGEEGSSYTALTAVRGAGESDGTDVSVWAIGKARRSVRLKVVQSGAAARFILRRVVLRVRGSGR
jgi:hypothetical protein